MNINLKIKVNSKNRMAVDKYQKSLSGVITGIYGSQKQSCKRRNHPSPKYNKESLSSWLFTNGFYAMWCQWNWSGFDSYMKPSCDRIDDLKTYSLDNIRLITWEQNQDKSIHQRKNGVGTPSVQCVGVSKYSVNGKFLRYFRSQSIASRATGINNSSIAACCRGERKSAGGFLWKKN